MKRSHPTWLVASCVLVAILICAVVDLRQTHDWFAACLTSIFNPHSASYETYVRCITPKGEISTNQNAVAAERATMAAVVNKLAAAKVAVIGFDRFFKQTSVSDGGLIASFEKCRLAEIPVILGDVGWNENGENASPVEKGMAKGSALGHIRPSKPWDVVLFHISDRRVVGGLALEMYLSAKLGGNYREAGSMGSDSHGRLIVSNRSITVAIQPSILNLENSATSSRPGVLGLAVVRPPPEDRVGQITWSYDDILALDIEKLSEEFGGKAVLFVDARRGGDSRGKTWDDRVLPGFFGHVAAITQLFEGDAIIVSLYNSGSGPLRWLMLFENIFTLVVAGHIVYSSRSRLWGVSLLLVSFGWIWFACTVTLMSFLMSRVIFIMTNMIFIIFVMMVFVLIAQLCIVGFRYLEFKIGGSDGRRGVW